MLDQIAGKHAIFDVIARAEDGKDTQMTVDCDFGELGDCGRKRYAVVHEPLVEYHEHDGARLTTSTRRPEDLLLFRDKWEDRLTRADLRRIEGEALAVRRRATGSAVARAVLLLREARLVGVRESWRRWRGRRAWVAGPAPSG